MGLRFLPLGYRFEVVSPMSKGEAIAAIRKRKKGWLVPKRGARGWIVGPFICLWWSATDQYGPMVLARIETDGFGTKIVGRAGADLNGTLMFLLLAPIMAWITFKMAEQGQGSLRLYLVIGIVFGLGLPLTLWINHKDRRDADPLVNFIRKTIEFPHAGKKS
jgi:hypothetical protein